VCEYGRTFGSLDEVYHGGTRRWLEPRQGPNNQNRPLGAQSRALGSALGVKKKGLRKERKRTGNVRKKSPGKAPRSVGIRWQKSSTVWYANDSCAEGRKEEKKLSSTAETPAGEGGRKNRRGLPKLQQQKKIPEKGGGDLLTLQNQPYPRGKTTGERK